jgi:phosphoserine phosphatase RsbU/P
MNAVMGRLLVVDDNLVNRGALVGCLVELGHTVDVADDGVQALEKVAQAPFDLVLLGINMPRMNGYEVLEHLKADPHRRHIPVIVLSSVSDIPSIVRGLQLGAVDYLPEPYDLTLLRTRIATTLDTKRSIDDERARFATLEQLSSAIKDVILPLGISLSDEKDTDLLLERILLAAKTFCHADAATLYVRTGDERLRFAIVVTDSLGTALGGTTGRPVPFAPLPLYDEAGAPNDCNIASQAALLGRSINIPNIYETDEFDFSKTREFDRRNNYRSISTLTVPMKDHDDRVIAVMQLLNATIPETGEIVPFDSMQQLVVEALASQAAIVFYNQLLLKRQSELLKFEHDLQIGRQIQADFLPAELPQHDGWDIAAFFEPAREVAGDFFDAFPLPGNRMAFLVADVCDKGVGAALYMALVRSLIRAFAQQRYHTRLRGGASTATDTGIAPEEGRWALKEVVELTNDYVVENHQDLNMFATLFIGVLEAGTGQVTYVNCGHNPPVLCRAPGARERLNPTGPAVGMLPGFDFKLGETQLDPGDLLVLFTDGVTDARDPHGEMFQETRLLTMLEEQPGPQAASATVQRIREELMEHIDTAAQYDDITLLAIHRAS